MISNNGFPISPRPTTTTVSLTCGGSRISLNVSQLCRSCPGGGGTGKAAPGLVSHIFDHFISHFWKDGKGKDSRLITVGGGKIRWLVAEISVGRIKRQSFRIVQRSCYFRIRQRLFQRVAFIRSNHIKMINMASVLPYFGRSEAIDVT